MALLPSACAQQPVPEPPRLALILVVDGLSQTQLLQHRKHYTAGGFRRLLEEGARLTDAHYRHASTLTATGHATLLTGAHPGRHGLVGNYWLNARSGETIYSVEDPRYHHLGEASGPHSGTSPENLRVETLGDQLLSSNPGTSRVLAISGKDRSAILSAGRMGTAYFFSERSGRFLTSSYYRERYPDWWTRFFSNQPQNQWFGSSWEPLLEESQFDPQVADGRSQHVSAAGLGKRFPHPINGGENRPGPGYYYALIRTPFGNDHTLEFARAAIKGELLGKRGAAPDLLILSLSSQDHLNHLFGPESRQAQDHVVRLDRSLARFFEFLDSWLERSQTLVVLTSDHGFPNTPEDCRLRGMDAGRIDSQAMIEELNEFLSKRFGAGRYALSWLNPTVYLDPALISQRKLEPSHVESAATDFLLAYPGIEAVFTRTQIETGVLPDSPLGRQVAVSWDNQRSGHLFLIQEPCWYLLGNPHALASTHGSPHRYDTHVPLIFLGPWFESGDYPFRTDMVDLTPTLAKVLEIQPPEASSGRVLEEILAESTGR